MTLYGTPCNDATTFYPSLKFNVLRFIFLPFLSLILPARLCYLVQTEPFTPEAKPGDFSTSVKLEHLQGGSLRNCNCRLAGLGKLSLDLNQKQNNTAQTSAFGKPSLNLHGKEVLTHSIRVHSASLICAAALNARCGAEGQTQTVEKPVSVITNAPVHGKEKSPQLDDRGVGLPPRDDDGGGGGGGGGGGWAGGFFFFGFLAFLGFLNDRDSDGSYERRRRK